MTEIKEYEIAAAVNEGRAGPNVSPAVQRFILHWGDLGATWGVSRSVAQIHALLLVSAKPLNAEEIADVLQIARSNVSTSLRELMGYGLIRRAPIFGDRRDHFEAEGDVWEMTTKIVAIRKAREIDPAAAVLKSCLEEAKSDPATPAAAVARLAEMNSLINLLDGWHAQVSRLPKSQLLPLIKMGARAVDILTIFLKEKRKDGERD